MSESIHMCNENKMKKLVTWWFLLFPHFFKEHGRNCRHLPLQSIRYSGTGARLAGGTIADSARVLVVLSCDIAIICSMISNSN